MLPLALERGYLWRWLRAPELHRQLVTLVGYLYVCGSLLIVTFTDIRHYMVPDQVTKVGTVVGVLAGRDKLEVIGPSLSSTRVIVRLTLPVLVMR